MVLKFNVVVSYAQSQDIFCRVRVHFIQCSIYPEFRLLLYSEHRWSADNILSSGHLKASFKIVKTMGSIKFIIGLILGYGIYLNVFILVDRFSIYKSSISYSLEMNGNAVLTFFEVSCFLPISFIYIILLKEYESLSLKMIVCFDFANFQFINLKTSNFFEICIPDVDFGKISTQIKIINIILWA